ncbi:TP53-binding protein 1 [Lampris incognitus]|uniref:TP53-binding protein 1 n=1 Tax=Lampris incognitus TaxID=2546036 RepID=UPI0024B5516B|nr:TP53-binding protein 1 [Lampris incognitus]
MDPGGSDLDFSLPQPENPCLIVEDSQPDSVALEEDPDSGYRALLSRRLSSLQPSPHSPVLELISSPAGSRCSQTDSQSEMSLNNKEAGPAVLETSDPSSAFQQESQVINICPPPNKKKYPSGECEMDSGADSTTHCSQSEGGTSQFGFLELSETQGLGGDMEETQVENEVIIPQNERNDKPAEQKTSAAASESQDNKSTRSEVSSSSSTEPGQTSRELSVQVLLHSEGLESADDAEILSSQEDLFDGEKTGAGVDSTVSEPENRDRVSLTPATTLRLLHLSGQGALVQESLSQSSVDYVAPTPDHLRETPVIVPNSPTGPEHENGAGEPMDTSLPPDDQSGDKEEEPMDMDPVSKPRPSASTPVSQNSPGFVLEKNLSQPSQPEFSHDIFVPTQSQEAGTSSSVAPQDADRTKVTPSSSLVHPNKLSPTVCESAPFSSPLRLTEDIKDGSPVAAPTPDQLEEDSQATQIDGLDEELCVDTSDSVTSCHREASQTNGFPSETKAVPNSAAESHLTLTCGSSKQTPANPNVQSVDVSKVTAGTEVGSSGDTVSCSQSPSDPIDVTLNSCDQEPCSDAVPCSPAPQALPQPEGSQSRGIEDVKGTESAINWRREGTTQGRSECRAAVNSQTDKDMEEEEEMEEGGENTLGPEGSGLGLVLSQSQALSPEPMEEEEEENEGSFIVLRGTSPQLQRSGSQPVGSKVSVSTNGHGAQAQSEDVQPAPDRLSQTEREGPEPDTVKDKSLSDSSGEIPFHFTLPKEGEMIGPVVSATPPLINQLKQTPRHSTPIEITSLSEKSAVVEDVSVETEMAASDIVAGDSGEEAVEKADGKLSLRMKLVTPVEEGSSERFSLQKPEEDSVVKVTTVATAVTSSPSVFSRIRQVHRQLEAEDNIQPVGAASPVRMALLSSSQRASQTSSSSQECKSLPDTQLDPASVSEQEVLITLPETSEEPPFPAPQADAVAGERGVTEAHEPSTPKRTGARQRAGSQPTSFDNAVPFSPSSKLHQKTVSHQPSCDGPGLRSPSTRVEPESPSFRRSGPAHRRHVRTIQEVRTTVTRIITDVYYEDGKEVERKVTEECEDPVVECQVLDSDISPCRTGSSITSGDLGDISSLSSKASSLQHSSGGTTCSSGMGPARPDFIMPSSRGARSIRGGGSGLVQRGRGHDPPQSASEDEPLPRPCAPRLLDSPTSSDLPSRSDSLRSSPEEGSLAASSLVGLRVVAKWSSNGYFYSGRITQDAGEGRFLLLFDDGYECDVAGKDILLCDPIPVETEVTALLEDEYFSVGVVKDHKTEAQQLYYSVERDGERRWYNRSSVILSLEQGNRLRENHSLGPYEPTTPLAKAADISLDNLVEGKRKRRGGAGDQGTPTRSSSSSPRNPGPSGKRKLMSSEGERSAAKRGRRGAGPRSAQRVGVCNTSGSGTDLPGQSCDLTESHGPLPQSSSLFMGFAFMLTASSETDRLTNKLTSDDEEEYVQTAPYNRGYTESQLQAGGGFILLDFNEEQCKAAYQSLLIADQHCRTRKYLLCVASGVPCVSHIWVRDCCKENKLLNYRNYLLPAGIGPDQAIVEWHPRCSPFSALRVLLVFKEPTELWAQLLSMSGAASVRHYQADKDSSDIQAGKFDVVVTDAACPPLVETKVTSQQVPLVSPEWLIQSLICGELLGYHSKPQYRHDYASS